MITHAQSFIVSVCLFSMCTAASDATSTIRYQTDTLRPLNMPPTFDNGLLALYERHGGVRIFARSGAQQYDIPKPPNGSITSVAIDRDGVAATAVGFGSNKGAVWLWDAHGSRFGVIEIADYKPSYVAFAPDGSIWTTGRQERDLTPAENDYLILRHFSRDGTALGAFLPRSSFAFDREPAEPTMALPALRIAGDRIGMYFSGGGKGHYFWVEADLNGHETGRWPVGVDGLPVALLESGMVFAHGSGITYVLDRATGKWMANSTTPLGTLVGAAGNSLAFADPRDPIVYLVSPGLR